MCGDGVWGRGYVGVCTRVYVSVLDSRSFRVYPQGEYVIYNVPPVWFSLFRHSISTEI